MSFIDEIKEKAKSNLKTIVLPESEDIRTYEAIEEILKEKIANIILIGKEEEINKYRNRFNIDKITVVDPLTYEKTEEYINKFVELRKHKNMQYEEASKIIKNDYTYFGVMMVKNGDADGLVSGACHSTANTLRPCLQILKTKPGVKLVSSFFIMEVPDCKYGEDGIFLFTDCGLEQNPDSEKLANIAISASNSFKMLIGKTPRIALLSHSTKGSSKHTDVDKVVNAYNIIKKLDKDIIVDGELQLDAAIIPEVAELKAKDSLVAGKANILIFPDLDAGNIGYKLVQRLAKAQAYGPITQGILKPVNDLSRGCSGKDIVGVVAITAVQCQNN